MPGVVMNTFHLLSRPGVTTVKAAGGLNAFTAWDRPILTDSGKTEVWHHTEKRDFVLPGREKEHTDAGEKCIQGQFGFGADVMMCLDYCTRPDDTPKYVMGLGSPRELWPAGRQGTTSLTASSPPGRPGTTGSMSLMWRKRGQVKRPPRHKRWGKRTKGTRPKKKEG